MIDTRYKIDLQWKEFNIAMPLVEAWMRSNAGPDYSGNQALDNNLELWFSNEPEQDIKDLVEVYWDGLDAESDEATQYISKAGIAADKASKKASGKAKLLGLGLSEDEVAVLVG